MGVFYLRFIFFPVIRSIKSYTICGWRPSGGKQGFEGVAPLALAAARYDVHPLQVYIDGGA